jgi:hypothetical protein
MPLLARAHVRGAAVALACALVAFLIGQLALGYAVEHWLPGVRDPEYDFKIERLQARRVEGPDRPLVLVLGSSRVGMALQASRIHTSLDGRPALVFNFGMSGGGSLVEWLCLRRLLAAGLRPDYLVLEVLPATLNQPGDHPVEEEWLDGARLRASELAFLNRYHSEPERPLRRWAKGRGLPGLWLRANLRTSLGLDTRDPRTRPERIEGTMDGHGWRPYCAEEVSPERRQWLTWFAGRQYSRAWGEFRIAAGPARALWAILACCRQEGIPAALLLMPEGSSFRTLYTPSMQTGIDSHLEALAREWDVPLIDARLWLDDRDFWDGHHVLPRGAAAFTARFEQEVLGALLGKLPQDRVAQGRPAR